MSKEKKSCRDQIESLGLDSNHEYPVSELIRVGRKQGVALLFEDDEAIEVLASTTVTEQRISSEILSIYKPAKFKRESFQAFSKEQAEEVHETRKRKWDQWKQEAERLTNINPRLAGNKSELARRIKKKLELKESVRTIRYRI